METHQLTEIIDCLPKGKTHYRYYKGAYAPRLLSLLINNEASIRELKQSRFKSLLHHPLIKQAAANSGNGKLTNDTLDYIWQEPSIPFLLTVSRWGGMRDRDWYQTSRFGENLVLQLNLPKVHRQMYKKCVDQEGKSTINGRGTLHPVQRPYKNANYRDTLAWARIDIDLNAGEALIEEIQSDAVRNVAHIKRRLNIRKCKCKACQVKRHYVAWFMQFSAIWSEAMMMATLSFIKEEIGITRIYYHTDRSGWQLKKMAQDWRAPKSLYTDLPKKFGFKQTWAAPELLLKSKTYYQLVRKQPDIDFYFLDMGELN